jgi:hypothetical protein
MAENNGLSNEMDEQLDAFAKRAAAPLRAPVALGDDFSAETMAVILASPLTISKSQTWLTRPTNIRVTPLTMLASAAAVVLAVALGTATIVGRGSTGSAQAVAGAAPNSSAAESVQVVRFQLAAPNAHSVALVGDFNDWSKDAIILKPAETPGVWTASVPIKRGRHEYAFIVDGKSWVPDPYANTHTDEYNVKSSVLNVGDASTE